MDEMYGGMKHAYVDINETNDHMQQTALHLVCSHREADWHEPCRKLAYKDRDYDEAHRISNHRRLQMVEHLVEVLEVRTDLIDRRGRTAFMLAVCSIAHRADSDIAAFLAGHIDVNQVDGIPFSRCTAFLLVCELGQLVAVKLLAQMVDVNTEALDAAGRTPFIAACGKCQYLAAEAWNFDDGHSGCYDDDCRYEQWSDKYLTCDKHHSSHNVFCDEESCASCQKLRVVRYLAEELKLDTNRANRWGQTPLMFAAASGELHIVRYLVEVLHADLNQTDHYTRTALYYATHPFDDDYTNSWSKMPTLPCLEARLFPAAISPDDQYSETTTCYLQFVVANSHLLAAIQRLKMARLNMVVRRW
jgi:ankyrin repeat protein